MIKYRVSIKQVASGMVNIEYSTKSAMSTADEVAVAQHLKTALNELAHTLEFGEVPAGRPHDCGSPSVNDQWLKFAEAVYNHRQIPLEVRMECRRAFFAGQSDMLEMIKAIAQRFTTPEEKAGRRMLLEKELSLFFQSIASRCDDNAANQ